MAMSYNNYIFMALNKRLQCVFMAMTWEIVCFTGDDFSRMLCDLPFYPPLIDRFNCSFPCAHKFVKDSYTLLYRAGHFKCFELFEE